MTAAPFILASASPRRKALLGQIGVIPDLVEAADIDETPLKGEIPREHALRLACEKANAIAGRHPKSIVLGSDTVVACGRRILPKTEDEAGARECLALLSGRAHRVYSGVAVITTNREILTRTVETRVKVRCLDQGSIDDFIITDEWRGKAGGYAIQGAFSKHVISISGSYSNVVGLPLYETWNLLAGAGLKK